MLKLLDADPDSGSGMFFALEPGSGMEKIIFRDPE